MVIARYRSIVIAVAVANGITSENSHIAFWIFDPARPKGHFGLHSTYMNSETGPVDAIIMSVIDKFTIGFDLKIPVYTNHNAEENIFDK